MLNYFKKALLVICLSMFSLSAMAQKPLWEVTGAVGFSNYKVGALKSNGTGFKAGVISEFSINKVEGLYTNAGVLLSLEGYKYDDYEYSEKANAYFINIPVHIGYKYGLSDKIKVFGEAGPYFGMGVGGKYKCEDFEYNEEEKYDVFGSDGILKRCQFGLGFKVGVVANKHLKFYFGWDWNLLNSVKADSEGMNYTLKHSCGTIGIGYVF